MDLLNLLIGGGLFGLIQYLINRHDNKHDKFKAIEEAIEKLSERIDKFDAKGDERNAVNLRVRILRFRNEMLVDRNHSHDEFQQVLDDIEEYEKYCLLHPEFKNGQTVATIEHIKRNYQERLEKHDFL